MQLPLTLSSKHLGSLTTETNRNHVPFQSIELEGVFTQVAIRVLLVGSFGGTHPEDYGTHGAVTLVWRCNNCTVVMHNDTLDLRYDRRQASDLIDRLRGPVNGDLTGASIHPMDGVSLTSGIDFNFVENNLMNIRYREDHLEGDNILNRNNWPDNAAFHTAEHSCVKHKRTRRTLDLTDLQYSILNQENHVEPCGHCNSVHISTVAILQCFYLDNVKTL